MTSFEVVSTRTGAFAIRDTDSGELMHPVGPLTEANQVYIEPSRLSERLMAPIEEPLVLFDVGLGAGTNAILAWQISERRPAGRRLEIVSFDRTTEAMAVAVASPHAAMFGYQGPGYTAAHTFLAEGQVTTDQTTWHLVLGNLPDTLNEASNDPADIVFWDPFSPDTNPGLWNHSAFSAIKRACGPQATLHTYSAATAVRSAMLLAGFSVGFGAPTGPKSQTTVAALDLAALSRPLDARWLERLTRSSAPWPTDAPDDAMSQIRTHPQFRGLSKP